MGVHWRATVHADKSGKPAVLLGSMDELVLGQRIDSLTGLWNYDKCTEDLESAVLKEEGYFIVFGIDNFKHINVKNGRPFGNDVLKRMTESLEKNADCSVTLYRLDGDCFAATLPGKGKKEVFSFYDTVRQENIQKSFDGNLWIITKRQKTNTDVNVPLLDIPKMISKKYKGKLPDGKILPVISNQKLPSTHAHR